MKTLLGSTGLLSILLVTAGCGAGLKCADGTFKSGDKCISYDPDDETAPVTTLDPPGGKTRFKTPTYATLTSNEPALIYWTNDGTEPTTEGEGHPSPALVTDLVEGATVKFFAVDLAGNVAPTTTTTFDFDPLAPAKVDLQLAFTGSNAEVTWANPADVDFQGTILARVTGNMDFVPTLDTFYTTGMVVSSNVELVQVGTDNSFSDPGVGFGAHYVAWTFDDIANYSAPDSVRFSDATGTTAGTLSIVAATNVVTVNEQPSDMTLSATAVFAAGTLTLNLSVENLTGHYFQNPRIAVTAVAPGTFSNSDGTVDGFATKYYGPTHLSPGETVMRTLTFTGVLVTDTVVLDVSIVENPSLVGANVRQNNATAFFFNDSSLGGAAGAGTGSSVGAGNNGRGSSLPSCVGADGRYLYSGNDHRATVDRFDLSTGAAAGSVQFQPAIRRFGVTVACDSVSDTIVAVTVDASRRSNGNNHVVVKLNPDLTTIWSIPFTQQKDRGIHFGSISPGGNYFAVAMQSRIAIFDLFTQEHVDADPSTTAIDDFETGAQDQGIRFVRWSQDGRRLLVKSWWDNGLFVISMPNGVDGGGFVSTLYGTDQNGTRAGSLAEGPDNRVWLAADNGLWVFDPSTDLFTSTPYVQQARGVEFIDGELYVNRTSSNIVDIVDETGAIDRSITLNAANRRHDLVSTKIDD